MPRHKILVATQVGAMLLAFALAALTLGGHITVGLLFVLATALGVVMAFEMPSRQAFVGEMVDRAHLMNAIALNSSIVNGARVVGPAVAGLVVAAIGEGWCFFANGVSFLAVIAGLLAMRDLPPPRPPSGKSARAELREGLRFAFDNEPVRALLLLLVLVSMLAVPFSVLLPVFADRILGGGARTLGILSGATGVGALVGALAIARREEVEGLGRWLTWGAVGFGFCLVAFAWSRHIALSCALLGLAGFAMMVLLAGSNAVIQAMVPDRLRGRVMALWGTVILGGTSLGSLPAGVIADQFGAPWTVTIGGSFGALAGIAFGRQLPALRASARELIRGAAAAGTE
jgi:MFS family permease